MKYPGIEMNEKMQLLKCAVCDNEEIAEHADFCIICGIPVYNKCLGSDYDNEPCEHICQGNARYCELCGSETLFLHKAILKAWDYEEPESLTYESDLDDSLPF